MELRDAKGEILEKITHIIVQVIGDEFELDEPITMETSFNSDLEIESIEFVALMELVEAEYGSKINITGWLSTKDLDDIIEFVVGDLVEYIAQWQ